MEESPIIPDASTVIGLLVLERHPEGGWYRETWRHDGGAGRRGAGTAIYYLLSAGEVSAWHRVDATEIWHWYGG
ncbi:cupin domain-containing protein, partial [Vibrio parahaemolyticus]